MGQQNETEDPEQVLNQLKSYERHLKKNNIFSEDSFIIAKNIAKEYINYKSIIDKNQNQKKKPLKERKNSDNYDKNKIEEINHKLERITKWIKMTKTPFKNNFQLFLNYIIGDDKKVKNKKLYQDKSTGNIFNKGRRKKNNPLDNNILNQDNKNNEILTIKNAKKKRISSSDKYKNNNEQDDNEENNIIIQNYTDKNIEEKIILFYNNNKSKFKERVYKGPPESFRWLSWCIVNEVPLERDINIYNNYLVQDLQEENKNAIIRDIQRTFSDAKLNKAELRKKETSLYNVLKAFWNLDNELGYCQGMNLLVGFMLLISQGNELDTFYLLVSNFSNTFNKRKAYEYSFRGLFSEEFPLLTFLNFIFDILLEENIPEIKNHLDELGITYDLWIGQWFQTLFTIVLPLNWCKRVWDCIFAENIFFLVKFGLVFTKILKSEILEKEEEIDVINFFKEMQKFSMCQENKFLEDKSDINTLITKANKIKLDPEEYIKLYKKRNENYNEFKLAMDKNDRLAYSLEKGNSAWNDFKINTRNTVLFEDEKKEKKEKGANLQQIEEMYGEDDKEEKNIIEDEDIKNNEIKNKKNENKKIEVKINKHQIKNENDNQINIKPILKRKDNDNSNKKILIQRANKIDNDIDINNYFDINKNEEPNDNVKKNNNETNPAPYKKKKVKKFPSKKYKDNNINKNEIKIDKNDEINPELSNINKDEINNNNNNHNIINNVDFINENIINNNINYNISNNQNNMDNNIYNDYNNKYYKVNLDDDNKNLERYYSNKMKK